MLSFLFRFECSFPGASDDNTEETFSRALEAVRAKVSDTIYPY